MDTVTIIHKITQNKNLTSEETQTFLDNVIKGNVSQVQIAAILTAFRVKGETSDEIVGLIKSMRTNMIKINARDAIDVCGTGGDGIGSFNISTAVALVVAGAGVKVVKHGNRAASSKCGSADVLEKLGVNFQISPQQAEEVFNKVGMIFLFAPLYHPSIKRVAEVRKELKIRTVFNFLGPFVNPASVEKQLVGVPTVEIAQKLAEVGKKLSYKHLLIVTGNDGLDEISIASPTVLFEIKKNSIRKSIINPVPFEFKKNSLTEILGDTPEKNAKFIKDILNGVKNSKRDIVVFNSAFALYAADKVTNIKEGIKLAEQSIDNGNAKFVMEYLIRETQKYA